MPGAADILFLEVDVVDPSECSDVLHVRGVEVGGFRIPRVQPDRADRDRRCAARAALRDATGVRPHCYFFEWAGGSPLAHLVGYLLLGRGDTAPVVREIIRSSEPDPAKRPASTSAAEARAVLRFCRTRVLVSLVVRTSVR